MIRLAIVEDEINYIGTLQEYLSRFCEESGAGISVSVFGSGEEIVNGYAPVYDIILMDIQMEGMDGMAAAHRIRETDQDVVIMFITNRADYAIRGYEVDALDYIVKPVDYFFFAQKMTRALTRIRKPGSTVLTYSTRNGLIRMSVKDILFVESEGHVLAFHTTGGIKRIREKMQSLEDRLRSEHFFRCNKGYLVNLRYVDGIQDGWCVIGEHRLLISRGRKTPLMEALAAYIAEN